MKLYNQGFPFLYNTFYQGGDFARGGRVPRPHPWLRLWISTTEMSKHVKESVSSVPVLVVPKKASDDRDMHLAEK